jgi:hypothetical protein
MMRKNWHIWASILAALLLAGLLGQAAQAGNFHFNNLTFNLGSLIARGTLVGLGNQAAEVTLTAYGKVTALCQNKGGQQAPGRNPIVINTQQTRVFVTDQNGRALVEVRAPDPSFTNIKPSPTPKEAGCPNGNWAVVGVVDGSTNWTAARIVVKDEAGRVQLDLSFTCTTFFTNGISTDVSCVQN